jgi:predicted nucleotidyltransferase
MPATRELAIPIPHEEIAAFCRKWGVRSLAFFGSVVRDDFRPESDIDVLVEFREPIGLFQIVHAEDELSTIFGRKVDLVEKHLLNRWMRADILNEAVREYVEAE